MNPPDSSQWLLQVVWLVLLAIPIACVAWTVTHEEIFREPRDYCVDRSRNAGSLFVRKFFYLFTCEYCFSHYVTIFFLIVTRYRLLLDDWRGYLIAFFALVAVANVYMSSFGRLRQEVKSEKLEAKKKEKELEESPVVVAPSLTAAGVLPNAAPKILSSEKETPGIPETAGTRRP